MNYAYNYNPRIGFSSASTATSTVLNPSNVREFDFTVSGLTPDAVDLITTSPFRFRADTSRLDAAGNGLANIDWNLSGDFDPGSIRGPATWCPWPGEATKANLQPLMERPEAEFFRNGATPDMVRVGNRLYAFYVDRYGRLKYRYGTLGPKSRGSCLSQQLGESCLTWSPEATFPTPRDVQAVSIVNWNDRLVVAYSEETLTSSQCEQKIAYSSAIDSDGSIASWSSSGFGRLVQCRDVELVTLPVDTTVAPGGKILSIFARAYNDELLWIKSTDPLTPGTWTTDRARDGAGNVLEAPIPPAVTVWPAPDYASLGSTSPWSSLATACGVFPAQRTQPDGSTVVEARFYCFDRAAARWVQKTDFPAFRLTEKPTVAFHILRRADGEPIDATNLPGQFWIGYVPEGERTGRVAWIHVSSKIDRTTPPTRFADWDLAFHGRHGNFWDYVTPNTGVVLHEELGLGALKGLANAANAYYFQPFADGSFQAELKTGNDFHVMEANLCRPLRGAEPYCQGVAHTPFRY
jgi:hypothetical protein